MNMQDPAKTTTIPLGISPSELPALSTHRMEVLKTANDPNVTVGRLEEVIGRDQSLALRVLKIANSPLYGRSGDVKSIRRAVFLLGRDQIKHVAAALAIAPVFDTNVEGLVEALCSGSTRSLPRHGWRESRNTSGVGSPSRCTRRRSCTTSVWSSCSSASNRRWR